MRLRFEGSRASGALVLVALGVLSACGGGASDTADGSPSTASTVAAATDTASAPDSTTDAPTSSASSASSVPATDAASTDTTAPAPTGPPILLGVFGSSQEQSYDPAVAGASAAAAAINARGGLDGRPLEIVPCDIGIDPNTATECGRRFVEDGVVATVGSGGSQSAQVLPILESAGIVSLGHFSVDQTELLAANTFPLISGGLGLVAGQGAMAEQVGATTVRLARADLSGAATLPVLFGELSKGTSIEAVGDVAIPVGAPDMSPYVAAATADDVDAVGVLLVPEDALRFAQLARQLAPETVVIVDGETAERAIANDLGQQLDGVYAVSWMKPAMLEGDPAIDRFNDEMDGFGSDAVRSQTTVNAWASVYLLEAVVRIAGEAELTPAAIGAAVTQVVGFDVGVAPPVSFDQPVTVIEGIPLQVFNPNAFLLRVEDGALVPVVADFVDVLSRS